MCERGGGEGGGVRVFRAASVGVWWGAGGGAGERVSRMSWNGDCCMEPGLVLYGVWRNGIDTMH